ncbi:hypothetical protein MY8738_000843 [Beauveria namnaoensis]
MGEKHSSDVSAASQAVGDISQLEAQEQLRNVQRHHLNDPNLPDEFIDEVADALASSDPKTVIAEVEHILEDSPYPEVRAAVRISDEDVPANTIRAWVIGMLFTTVGSGLNMLFSMRAPSITITTYVAQLLCHPVGVAWSWALPNRQFSLFGLKFNLNPGPWNKKEHTLVVIMANVSFGGGSAFSTDIILALKQFYKQDFGWGFQLLLTFTISMCGFGMAGLFRRYLVEPAAMIWPTNLINTSLFYALHDHSPSEPARTNGWSIGRYRWFSYVCLGSFLWYWFPGFIAPFLSVFAFVTWIKPQSPVVNQLFGGWTGISLIPITFDWTQISGYTTSPLIFPWHAIANTTVGVVIFMMVTNIGIHYSNVFYNLYLPISDSESYDNTAQPYNVSRVLTPNYELDIEKYQAYSPLFLSATFTMAYGISFAAISSLVVHTFLNHSKEIWLRLTTMGKDDEDVHTRMYAKYDPVPFWWYAILFFSIFGMGLGTVLGYETHMPAWGYIVAMIIAWLFILPTGIIQGATNVQLGLNVLTEFMASYMLEGRPVANMLFKAYGYNALYQGLAFVSDMKMAMYMKVPPKTVFMGQVLAVIWSSIVQVAVLNWALGAINDICTARQENHFTCPGAKVYFNASVIWGVIGAQRMFGIGALYSSMLWFFLIGTICPVVTWFILRRNPRSIVRFVNWPIIFGGGGMIPPATALNYLSWAWVGFLFNKYIRNKYRGWWMQFNYITSAGLDVGLALSTILIFFALSLSGTEMAPWWGSVGALNTMDVQDTAIIRPLADGEKFGPKTW